MAPMRRPRSPRTTRQTAANQARSLRKSVGIGRDGVERGERIGDAVLREIVAGRHLAAEAIAAVGDGHLAGRIGRGLHQHGHVETGHAQGIGDGALVAEIGQCDDDAVDCVAMLLEELGAARGFGAGFDGAVFGILGTQRHRRVTGFFERGEHFRPSALREMAGEETAVTDDDSESHFGCPLLSFSFREKTGASKTRRAR